MTWVLEEPVYIIILGILMLAFLAFALKQTGYRFIFYAMLGVAALTGGFLLLERMVVTEKEQLEDDLHRIARDVESNDLDTICSHIYSGAPQVTADARREFARYKFNRVNIKNNVEAVFTKGHQPPKAVVTFNVVVDLQRDGFHHPNAPRFVQLTMMFENGHWRVADYKHFDPLHRIDSYSN